MKYIHKTNRHDSLPFTPKIWVNSVSGSAWFTVESKYDIGYPDQADWNKLCGISFNPIKPNQNAIMIAWRYNQNLKIFQIAPYFNVSGEILSPERYYPNQIIDATQFEMIQFVINYDEIKYRIPDISSKWVVTKVPSGLKTNKFTSFRVQPWFGGNRTPNQDISIILNFT